MHSLCQSRRSQDTLLPWIAKATGAGAPGLAQASLTARQRTVPVPGGATKRSEEIPAGPFTALSEVGGDISQGA